MSCEPGTGPFHGAGIAVGCWGCRYPLAPSLGVCGVGKSSSEAEIPVRALQSQRGSAAGGTTCCLPPAGWERGAETETASCVDREKAPGSGACLGASFPLPGGFGRCRRRSAAKLPHPRLLFGGGGRRKGWRLRFAVRFRRGGASRERWFGFVGDRRSKVWCRRAVVTCWLRSWSEEFPVDGRRLGLAARASVGDTQGKAGIDQVLPWEKPAPGFPRDGSGRGCFPCTHHLQSSACAGC